MPQEEDEKETGNHQRDEGKHPDDKGEDHASQHESNLVVAHGKRPDLIEEG